jgi:uncharacterized protein YwgA
MNRRDWVLLALDYAAPQALSPAQLQKSLFLLGAELPRHLGTNEFYTFVPYNYGPFSRQVYDDAEILAAHGLVAMLKEPGVSYPQYAATQDGQMLAATLRAKANPIATAYLERVVNWAKRQSFAQLVRSIYERYPAYRQNSVFQD